ncbi:sulfur carrier protein ThiS [Virgibacillus siamensis]|uniref:sulfur carrier protein ThiS n=1 Tax=Virgibacillus siamensis TaxID=480071 RepID=UPI0009860913|nr:sulfur carrier protein ThiS [Virgibacillus siamensis]
MKLVINGNDIQLDESVFTITDVMDHYHIDNKVVIVEHNGEIIDQSIYSKRTLADGDKIEFVQFVGGG